MKRIASLLILGEVFLSSCDPVRRIDMKNESADTAHIIWTLNEDSLMYNPFLLSNSKELKFSLNTSKRKEINMSFGAGSWSPKEVEKLVGHLTSLEIISPKQRIKIDSLPLLRE